MWKGVKERRQRRVGGLRWQWFERQVVDLEAAAEVANAMAIRLVRVGYQDDAMAETEQELAELVDVRLDPADPEASACVRERNALGK